MRKKIVLTFLFVLMFSSILCFLSDKMVLADNTGTVRRGGVNNIFQSVQFTVVSNAHATGTVYRTTGLKIWVGPYYAFFDQADLTSKGFYSSSTSDTVDFTASDIALRSGASVPQIRAAANDVFNGINLGAQIKVLQNGVVKATIEEKEQVAPVFNQYGLGHCVAAAETRWGWAYDPQKPISYTLTMQIQGQGSTDPTGNQAGVAHNYNLNDTVQLTASPIGGWQFAYWYDVLAGNSMATTPEYSITMNKNQTIRAVFIPDTATPPAVDPPPPEPPAPEPPPPPPPPPDYDPVADFDISNAAPVEGQTIQLHDDSSHPGAKYGEEIVSWEWTIEDQPGSSSQNVDVSWDTVGTYQVTLRVEDQDGDSDSCTKSVVVGPAMPAAVITLSSDSIMIGREFHVDGDESTAANGRNIKWDEMEWKFYGPDGSLKHDYTGRYPLGKGTPGEKNLTNSVLNETGNWKVRLKVKDTNDYESEWAERIFSIYPDQPPIADFWLVSETLRNSYQGYELTIHDQSHPAAPDGALGDEIYLRDWTLYYDGNNNGSYADPEDETIHPGDTGKAADLIQVSDNDTNPRIKFNKTGHYKVELTVRERAEVWGEITNGLTGNTSSKPALEKEITVINLAPTTAFEIQKKMPVDVQFAADYTVSDDKYNSLQSAQAEFIGSLEGGGIDPVTGTERVQAGELQQKYSVANPFVTTGEIQEISPLTTDWYYVNEKPNWAWLPKNHALNMNTGERTEPFSTYKLSDGTYFENFSTSVARIDADRNIITPKATYDSLISAAIPNNTAEWTYTFEGLLLSPDGSVFVRYKGEKILSGWRECKHGIQKINPGLTLGWNQIFMEYYRYWDETVTADLIHQFSDGNDFIFSRTEGTSYSRRDLYIASAGDNGSKNLGTYQFPTCGDGRLFRTAFNFSSANNGNYLIFTTPCTFYVIDKTGIIKTQQVPVDFTSTGMRRTQGKGIIGPYPGNKTAVFYQWVEYPPDAPGEDYGYLYMIDNTTGNISLVKTYTELWPGQVPKTQAWVNYFFMDGEITSDGTIGVRANYLHNVDDGPTDFYYSVIKPDFTITWTKYYRSTWRNKNTYNPWRTISNQSVNNTMFVHNVDEDDGSSSKRLSTIYKNYGTTFIANGENCRTLENGGFLLKYASVNRYYNATGSMLWQKPISEGEIIPYKLLFGGIVLKSYDAGKAVTRIINPDNGSILVTIPHEYIWHDSNRLLCYGIGADGSRDGTLRAFGQLQGLEYLKQVINNHSWQTENQNFIVSVIDGDKYPNFAQSKNSITTALQANHLYTAVISPSIGQTKTQADELIQGSEGGWWIQTAVTMPGPLDQLAQKIINQVNLERGAENIVLVNQEVELTGNYSDPETDPAGTMRWEFTHDPTKLGSYSLCNSMGMSSLNGAQMDLPPTAFDKAGTFQVRYRAKDIPVTNAEYINDPKAGAKWSSSDAYLTVLVHRKPIAAFTLSSTTIKKTDSLVITDNSYDPDLINTDPEGKKGLRNWEWQYRNTSIGEEWIPCAVIPSSFTSKGVYAIRLRVQDAHGAWSDWTAQQLFTVLNTKPVAAFEALPNPVVVNNPCSLIDSSYDPDGDPLINWEWTIQEIGTMNKVNPNPFPVSWPNVGDYLVTLRVQDSEGTWSDPVSQTVKVINHFVLTLESLSIQNGRGDAIATPGGNPPGPSGLNRVVAPVFPVNINSNEIGAYSPNQMVTLTAEPVSSGTYFLEWREGDKVISRNATLTTRMGAEWREGDETINNNTTCTISMTGNRTITAVFMKDPIFIPAVPPKIHVYIVK